MREWSLSLGLRDRAYLLALLLPLVVYNLSLKAISITSQNDAPGLVGTLDLMRSDILFNLGYAVFWTGVFAVLRRGLARGIVLVLFHAMSILVALVTTCAQQYFHETGSTLDYSIIVYSLGTLDELTGVIGGGASPAAWAALAAAILYLILGPWLVSRAAVRIASRRVERSGETERTGRPVIRVGALAACAAAVVMISLSALPSAVGQDRSFSRDPFVNVFVTGINAPDASELAADSEELRKVSERTLENASLRQTPRTEKRNVVFISMESTRARSVTPYNEDLPTTPYLDELAGRSLMAEWSYTTIPHTSKSLTAINCGIYPHPDTDIHESKPGGIPANCLPEMLAEQGYNTAFFQSATGKFEDRHQHAENFGYEHVQTLEQMDREGFERAGYLGYEDDIMLEPSREWLRENSGEPFVATYNTITPHHEYLAPDRYGIKDFAEDERLDGYLNGVRYVDFFIGNVIEQYKQMGEYEDTIFVIMGDHGEGFAEHGIRGHDNVIYDEGLRTPLIIHDPQRWQNGKHIEDASVNQLDYVPTLLDMMNYEVEGGEYLGTSMLKDIPAGRPLYFNCRPDLTCAASIEDGEKYIYHYGKRSDEYYDLRKDPYERNNIIDEQPDEEIERRKEELLAWRNEAAAVYEENGSSENSTGE